VQNSIFQVIGNQVHFYETFTEFLSVIIVLQKLATGMTMHEFQPVGKLVNVCFVFCIMKCALQP